MKQKKRCHHLNKVKISITLLLIIGWIIALFSPQTLQAKSNRFKALDIHVELLDNGDAWIEEVWDMSVYEGTELYKPETELGACEIFDFTVKDEKGNTFTSLGDWDVSASRSEKALKNGIHDTGDGDELCWGIGDYGERVYTIRYRMTNFVQAFEEADGFNQRLVNDQMDPSPEQVTISIEKDGFVFNEENTRIWAFGYQGNIHFVDGKILAMTDTELDDHQYMNILVRFEKGIFTPLYENGTSFESLKEIAFEGSDYEDDGYGNDAFIDDDYDSGFFFPSHHFNIAFIILPVGIVFVAIVVLISLLAKAGQKAQKGTLGIHDKDIDYYRDLPVQGSLEGTYFLLDYLGKMKNDTDIMGAYLLKWVQQGNIRMEERERKRFLGLSTKLEPSIVFVHRQGITSSDENELYDMLQMAAGKDEILQEYELKAWSEKHYTRLESWMDQVKHRGERKLIQLHGLEEVQKSSFFGLFHYTENELSETGRQYGLQVLGFKNYLQDFTLIHEREVYEVGLWKEYLIYAALYGIADKVAESFKNLYPKFFEEQFYGGYAYSNVDFIYTMMWINHMTRASHVGIANAHSAQNASSIGGGGGSASFGGGGGFSGGGSGGGVR